VARAPVELAAARRHAERAGEGELGHVERPVHDGVADLLLPEAGEALHAALLVLDRRRRALVLGTHDLAQPYREPVEEAARDGLEAARFEI